jgi:transcriptional regulator with XRE-family HTH domain
MLTPEVCRAARGLLGWTIRQLAEASGVGIMTISAFERGSRPAYASTLAKLAAAFEREGVELILEEARTGAAAARPEAAGGAAAESAPAPQRPRKRGAPAKGRPQA